MRSDIINVVRALLTMGDLLLESSDFISVSPLSKSICLLHSFYRSLRSCYLTFHLLDIFLGDYVIGDANVAGRLRRGDTLIMAWASHLARIVIFLMQTLEEASVGLLAARLALSSRLD